MIDVNNLSFAYSKQGFGLDKITFSSFDGQITAILGANGAGKSTVLKAILNLVKMTNGSVVTNGVDFVKLNGNEKAKHIAYVAQNIQFADMTVFEAVLLGRKPYIKVNATQQDLEIVESILVELALDKYSTDNVNHLSGGEKQKVAIARALAQQAPVMFFDEPTSNLDIKNQIEVMTLISKIAKNNNIAVVINMHDLNLAYQYASQFVLVKAGKVFKADKMCNLLESDLKAVFDVDVQFATINNKKYILI